MSEADLNNYNTKPSEKPNGIPDKPDKDNENKTGLKLKSGLGLAQLRQLIQDELSSQQVKPIEEKYKNPKADAERVINDIRENADHLLNTKHNSILTYAEEQELYLRSYEIVNKRYKEEGLPQPHSIDTWKKFYEECQQESERLGEELRQRKKRLYKEFLIILFGLRHIEPYVYEKVKGFKPSDRRGNLSQEDLSMLDGIVRKHGASVLEAMGKYYLNQENYNPFGLILLLLSGRLGESENITQIQELVNVLPQERRLAFLKLLEKVIQMHEKGGKVFQMLDSMEKDIFRKLRKNLIVSKEEGVVGGEDISSSTPLLYDDDIYFQLAAIYLSNDTPPEKLLEDFLIIEQ